MEPLQPDVEPSGANKLIRYAKKVSFPGFEKVPIYYVIRFFIEQIKEGQVNMRAASISFFFVLAIFPGILFFFNLIPLLPIPDFQDTLFNFMAEVLPETAFEFLRATIIDIINTQRIDLISIGFILTFYFSTQGMAALMRAFRKDQPIFRKRNFWNKQLTMIKLTAILFLLLVISIGLIVLGKHILGQLTVWLELNSWWQLFLLDLIRWIIIILTFFTSISFIYYFAPATKEKFRFVSIGSTVATIITIVSTLVFSFIVNNYNLYNDVYGSIGTLLVILIWILINSISLLVGFELNASIKYQKIYRQEKQMKFSS